MAQQSCPTWVLLLGLLWTSSVVKVYSWLPSSEQNTKLERCFSSNTSVVAVDKFNEVITKPNWTITNVCAVFLQKNTTFTSLLNDTWPQSLNDSLYISKHLINLNFTMFVLSGKCSNPTQTNFTESGCESRNKNEGECSFRCIKTGAICKNSVYEPDYCHVVSDRYILNVTNSTPYCISCDNPLKAPDEKMDLVVNISTPVGQPIAAADASKVMASVTNIISTMNGTSVAISVGADVTGVLVAPKSRVDIEDVSFAYASPNTSIDIVSSGGSLSDFSRSVSVPKEAFDKALSMNITRPFAALMRFNHMQGDALNSTILGNEVLAVEMGTNITNLTSNINITFRNMAFNWIPSCHSWDGEGAKPNWTQDGCETIINGSSITCQCSHLTFFAILMTAPNVTISSTDLNNLTIITQVGCGLSMFFLSIVLFMHFLMRKIKANKSTRILIHLVAAMFLLNLTFLINNFVANIKNSVGCKVMAAVMHYFMLATFTWFAAQAFHLCFQLYTGGKIAIQRYVLKLSITSWVIPSVVGIILLSTGKYGEQDIVTENSSQTVAMCWITESNVHYIVNIGYYALVFVFTFTTFILILSWLICLKRQKPTTKVTRNGKSIVTVMGLCSMLGITWGFAFFAYGDLRIPAYYIFTILNSFQGFFLFIYYYNIRQAASENRDTSESKHSTASTTTLKTSLDVLMNPYQNYGSKT